MTVGPSFATDVLGTMRHSEFTGSPEIGAAARSRAASVRKSMRRHGAVPMTVDQTGPDPATGFTAV